jgi:hypothetical protein
MSLIKELVRLAPDLATSSKFTICNGVLYMGAGLLLMIWPGAVQTLFRDPEFAGHESSLVRILGMTVTIIGWFYVFGGRSDSRQIVAASVLDRIVLVPLVLIPVAMSGVFPRLLLTFAVLDPLLGLVAWFLLVRERKRRLVGS